MGKPDGLRLWSQMFHSEKSRLQQEMVPGSRFVTADFRGGVWEIVDVAQYAGHAIPHVRLARVGFPRDTKTVSAGVLADRHFYRPANKI